MSDACIFEHATTNVSADFCYEPSIAAAQEDATYLYSLWMKAVWTTLGCWADVAAAALSEVPFDPFVDDGCSFEPPP